MNRNILSIVCLVIFLFPLRIKTIAQANVSQYNEVWNTPSDNSFGSMPLGNGDVGLNVWMEKNGDLLFYISKVNAYDANHILPKLGKIRVSMQPAINTKTFKQTLNLIDASVIIEVADVSLKVWVDANNPIINVESKSKTSRTVSIALEPLRKLKPFSDSLPLKGTVGVVFNEINKLVWCYRNLSSAWANNFKSQNTPEMVAKTQDPILYRTSGCVLDAAGFVNESTTVLHSKEAVSSFDCRIKVNSSQPLTLYKWLEDAKLSIVSEWDKHKFYWESFWKRSYINITTDTKGNFNLDQCRYTQFQQGAKAYEGHKEINAAKNVFQISKRYALERFCEAAASRGEVPPPYNGSIFTMDMPVGFKGFKELPKVKGITPDERDWAFLSFMWQNTRHPYWAMDTRGDYETLKPGMQFVKDGLEICKDHCKKSFGHEGAYIMEASWWHNVGVFNWNRMPPHLKYHQLATIETPAIMCEYYEHTHDATFLNDVLVPCAEEFLKYYELHFPKRNKEGIMQMEGVGTAETYQGVTNPSTEMGGMKYVLNKLITFPIDDEHRKHFSALLRTMPMLLTHKVMGLDLLAVGEKYNAGREICETPELYSVYPFRQAWLGTPNFLAMARQSFHVRNISLDGSADGQAVETGGWQASPVQAAYLGLPKEAARLVSINFNDDFINWHDNVDPSKPFPNRPKARFPAFWECKMDGTPDNDHGANSTNALQSMLLQSDGKKIFLLPAWPEDWNVSFKMHAANNTFIECVYRDGKVQDLKVFPEERSKDIVDMSSKKQRIRNLVEVALSDHNYLFGLPQMLDAQPIGGKQTADWLAKFQETIKDCKTGPWSNSLFKGNTAYIHILDWPKEGVRLSNIPYQLKKSTSISGSIQVKQDKQGIVLTGKPDSLNTIIKLEFNNSLDSFVNSIPSTYSFTKGFPLNIQKDTSGKLIVLENFEDTKTIKRFEVEINNPNHLRGQSNPFEIQSLQADGNWKTIYKGAVYWTICSKDIDETTSKSFRLLINATGIKRFDLY